ncbi:hypothetical protein BDR22DRAFT_238883 [Usnea florida]
MPRRLRTFRSALVFYLLLVILFFSFAIATSGPNSRVTQWKRTLWMQIYAVVAWVSHRLWQSIYYVGLQLSRTPIRLRQGIDYVDLQLTQKSIQLREIINWVARGVAGTCSKMGFDSRSMSKTFRLMIQKSKPESMCPIYQETTRRWQGIDTCPTAVVTEV